MKRCKRCKGTGRVYEDRKGESGLVNYRGFNFTTGKHTDVKGECCPRCGGRGEV